MLNKIMSGRLGNQMFQYAAVRAYQVKYAPDEPLNLNFFSVYCEGEREAGFYNQLEQFNIAPHVVDRTPKLSPLQYVLYAKYLAVCFLARYIHKKDAGPWRKAYDTKLAKKYQKHGLYLYSFGYYPFGATKARNKLFMGLYESAQYFNDIKPIIQKEFTPKHAKLDKNKDLYKTIETTNSVCVSIRRGDFLSSKFKSNHYVCTPEYFDEAIRVIRTKVKNPRFVIFSDDIKWVKENIKFPKGTVFEDGTDPVWEKLRLMYSCKHFIISNSTFSWWAQYLSRNNSKVVIAPDRWFNDNPMYEDIYEPDWTLINIDQLQRL